MDKGLITNLTRNKVYELYLQGKSMEEAANLLKISLKYTMEYYAQFASKSMQDSRNKFVRIWQAKSIEDKLFELIKNKADKSEIDNAAINYYHFCV